MPAGDDLMPISLFARRCGLTPSALRFYGDSGLLEPYHVDSSSGYRFYSDAQLGRARTLRKLRDIAMPLQIIEQVLDGEPDRATTLLDDYLATAREHVAAVERAATDLRHALHGPPALTIHGLTGPVLAVAMEQVLTATAHHDDVAALAGIRMEATPDSILLAATDRYRLCFRTLPAHNATTTWSGTIDGGELRSALPALRRLASVRVDATASIIRFRSDAAAEGVISCRLVSGDFPDYRHVLDVIGEPTTRVTASRAAVLAALENAASRHVTLRGGTDGLSVHPADGDTPATRLESRYSGDPVVVSFELTTLYPAVSTAIGPDVMLDLRGPDRPITVRSADHGDLTTVAMPIAPIGGQPTS